MSTVIDLLEWRRSRAPGGAEPAATGDERTQIELLDRLERAIRRLDSVASAALEASGALEGWVETELLAIMGGLAIDLLLDAATRAEHLADRLTPAHRPVRAGR